MLKNRYDAIVVGAGPAGCSAAAFLSRLSAYDVLLVDRAAFPRDKVCGDGISPASLAFLNEMGLADEFHRCNPATVKGLAVSSPSGETICTRFSDTEREAGLGCVLPRNRFDDMLVRHVRGLRSVDVLDGACATDVIRDTDCVSGLKIRYGKSVYEVKADAFVGADGIRSIFTRKGFITVRTEHAGIVAGRCYFEGVRELDNNVELYFDRAVLPGYVWIFPVDEGTANVGFGTIRKKLGDRNWKTVFRELLETNPLLRKRLDGTAMVLNSLKVRPIPLGSCLEEKSRGNVLLAGDAGGFADPLSGEGIYPALKTGRCAAEAIDSALKEGMHPRRIGALYEKSRRSSLPCREYFVSYLLQRFLLRRSVIDLNIKRAKNNKKMRHALVKILSGKKSRIRLLF